MRTLLIHLLRLSLAALALIPSAANAQFVIGPGGNGPGARISRPALDRYAAVLNLDDAQRQAAAALHEAYSESSRAASKEMQSKMKALEADINSGDQESIQTKLPAVMQEHAAKASELEHSFLSDLQALLTPQQSESAWPRFERLRRHEQGLRSGVLSGSNVDLVSVVDTMKLPAPAQASLADTLEQYQQDLDRALTEIAALRAKDNADQPVKRAEAGGGGGRVMVSFDPASMREHLSKQREDSTRIRDINQRYARLLAALLPDNLRAQLEEQVKLASFKSIYRESAAAKKLAAAAALPDLSPEQRTRLSELADTYKRTARAAGDRWAAAQQEAEAGGKALGGPGMQMRFKNDQDGKDPLAEARQARHDLDKKAAEDLDSLLNDDQRSRLPKTDLAGRKVRGTHGEDMDVLIDGDEDGEGGPGGAIMITSTHSMTDDGAGAEPTILHSVTITTPGDEAPKKEDKKKDKK